MHTPNEKNISHSKILSIVYKSDGSQFKLKPYWLKFILKSGLCSIILSHYLLLGCVNHANLNSANNGEGAKAKGDSSPLMFPASPESEQLKIMVKRAEALTVDIYDSCSYYDRKFIESLRYSAGAELASPVSNSRRDTAVEGLSQAAVQAERQCHESSRNLRKTIPNLRKNAIMLFREWRARIGNSNSAELKKSAEQSSEKFKIKYASMMASIRIVLLARKEIGTFLDIYHNKGFQSEEEFTRSKSMAIRMFEEETKIAFKDIQEMYKTLEQRKSD